MAHELYAEVEAGTIHCAVGSVAHTTKLWCHAHGQPAADCLAKERLALEHERIEVEHAQLKLDSQNTFLKSELEHLQRRVADLSGTTALRAALVAHHRPQHDTIEATLATVEAELAKVAAAGGEP